MNSKQPALISIQVGPPKELGGAGMDPMERPWRTGFFKEPVAGPVFVGRTNLAGDGQADLVNHGGVNKAVCVYSADHYDAWLMELERAEFPHGGFGENLTICGLLETEVCIGDVFAAGTVQFQISQPRVPCWKLARRWRSRDLPARVLRTGRTGWYFRVLQEGTIQAGDAIQRIERSAPRWTISRANEVMHEQKHDLEAAAALAALATLSQSWRETLLDRVEKLAGSDG